MLFLHDPVDEFVINSLRQYDGHDFINIDAEDVDIGQPDAAATAESLSPADATALVRRGYAAAFTAPDGDGSQKLVIITERATGTARSEPAAAIESIRTAVSQRHGVTVGDIRILPAGAIPRTTSGKLARRACRTAYLNGSLKGHQH